MNIYQLRDHIGEEIIDYNQLKSELENYSHPRGKISEWLKKGELIRVKKGLYVFGSKVSKQPYSLEVLANLIYGPSAVSLHYALSFYGLIPERVHTITSVTNKRNKQYDTPVGHFTYQYLQNEKYCIGIQLLSAKKGMNFLIATPEKALCDVILFTVKEITFKSQHDLEVFLLEDLRVEQHNLKEFDLKLMSEIITQYNSQILSQFFKYFKQWI